MRVFRSPERVNSPDPPEAQDRYFVSHNGEVKGPFELDMIDAFILSGHYPQNVEICAEGSNQWKRHSVADQTLPPPVARQQQQPARSKPAGAILKWMLIGGGTLSVLALMKMGGPSYPPKTSTTSSGAIYNRANGHTYSVPNSDYYRLLTQKKALEQEDALLTSAEAELDAEQSSLEQRRGYLDRTSQYEIDDFNAKIDALNAKRSQLRRQIATFNAHVDAFNADLARVGTPIR